MNNLLVMKVPHPTWVKNLKRDNIIWLVKEKCYAIIESPYQWKTSVWKLGQINLRRFNSQGEAPASESWWMTDEGRGFDNSQLILPVIEIGESYSLRELELLLTQIQVQLENISQRICALEDVLRAEKRLNVQTQQIQHTNGYCDTCGDMYVVGYELQHPKCRRKE